MTSSRMTSSSLKRYLTPRKISRFQDFLENGHHRNALVKLVFLLALDRNFSPVI